MSERDEVAAARERRDYLLSNYVEEEGPIEGSPCQIWQRCCSDGGYGWVRYGDFNYLAHRLMWVDANGPIPDGLQVRHRCDRPACISLDHLELGTQQDNMNDMKERGRAPSHVGSQNGHRVLNESDVRRILQLIEEGKSYGIVASEFRVGSDVICDIALGRAWVTFQRRDATQRR
jgi:hypothetical protein